MKKYDYVCNRCKNPVLREGWAVWDADKQAYVLTEVLDEEYCEVCESDTHSIKVEAYDPQKEARK